MTADQCPVRFSTLRHLLFVLLLTLTGCTVNQPTDHAASAHTETEQAAEGDHNDKNDATTIDVMPTLTAIPLGAGEKLRVVASTNLVADIVAQVGGEHITLHTLMGPAVDPHSYSATPQDLRTLEDAQIVFINGLQLEAALTKLLQGLTAPLVPVSVGITPRTMAEAEETHAAEEEHHHEGADPHVWQRVANVKIWVENVEQSLSQLDPANAESYTAAATAYRQQLDALDAEIRAKIATIPAANRQLVTDHETFGYFADEYGFTIVGALIPSLSTTAEPSAQLLATLQDQLTAAGVKAIFVGTTVNPRLAEQLAQDLGIQVVSLYSDSLSAADGPAATYVDFMRYNVDAMVGALQP